MDTRSTILYSRFQIAWQRDINKQSVVFIMICYCFSYRNCKDVINGGLNVYFIFTCLSAFLKTFPI